jgi:hypothetical protein
MAAAASHHELCMMAMATAIKPVKKNKNQNQYFLCVLWLPTPLATFFIYWRNKKIRNSKIR